MSTTAILPGYTTAVSQTPGTAPSSYGQQVYDPLAGTVVPGQYVTLIGGKDYLGNTCTSGALMGVNGAAGTQGMVTPAATLHTGSAALTAPPPVGTGFTTSSQCQSVLTANTFVAGLPTVPTANSMGVFNCVAGESYEVDWCVQFSDAGNNSLTCWYALMTAAFAQAAASAVTGTGAIVCPACPAPPASVWSTPITISSGTGNTISNATTLFYSYGHGIFTAAQSGPLIIQAWIGLTGGTPTGTNAAYTPTVLRAAIRRVPGSYISPYL